MVLRLLPADQICHRRLALSMKHCSLQRDCIQLKCEISFLPCDLAAEQCGAWNRLWRPAAASGFDLSGPLVARTMHFRSRGAQRVARLELATIWGHVFSLCLSALGRKTLRTPSRCHHRRKALHFIQARLHALISVAAKHTQKLLAAYQSLNYMITPTFLEINQTMLIQK